MTCRSSVRETYGDDRAEREPRAERDLAASCDRRPDERQGTRTEQGPDQRLPGHSSHGRAEDDRELHIAEGESASTGEVEGPEDRRAYDGRDGWRDERHQGVLLKGEQAKTDKERALP